MKSRYSDKAPTTAALSLWLAGSTLYEYTIFCTSYAVKPVKTITPIRDDTKYMAGLCKNMFTTDAIIIPNNPIIRNDPI